MNTEHYKPSYFYLQDGPGNDPIYFDFILANKDGLTWSFAAYGDGAHTNQVAVCGLDGKPMKACSNCYHNMQLETFLRESDNLVAVLGNKVVYEKGA